MYICCYAHTQLDSHETPKSNRTALKSRALANLSNFNSSPADQVYCRTSISVSLFVSVLDLRVTFPIFEAFREQKKLVGGEVMELRRSCKTWDRKLRKKRYDYVRIGKGYTHNYLWFEVRRIQRLAGCVESMGKRFRRGDWGIWLGALAAYQIVRRS